MHTALLTHQLRTRRDVVLVRQRARQISRLLGYDGGEQSRLAAAVFQFACLAFEKSCRPEISFRLTDGHLQVVCCPGRPRKGGCADGPPPSSVVERPLPKKDLPLERPDLAWAVQQLARLTPLNLFDEIRQQNQELVQALHELQVCQAESSRLRKAKPDAA
jgi:hypothetical protein